MVERIGELPENATGLSVSVVEPPAPPAPEQVAPVTVRDDEAIPDPASTAPAEWPVVVEPVARREATLLRVAWAVSVLILVLLALAAYGWRAEIMHVWPASERLYGALGLLPAGP
jgi:hypothetical protein